MRGIHSNLVAVCLTLATATGCTVISAPADFDDGSHDGGNKQDGAPPIPDAGMKDTAVPDAGPPPPCTVAGCFGKMCMNNSECMSGNCTDLRALRLSSTEVRVCSQACMRSSDCPGGTICWDSGSGVRACASPNWINENVTNAGTEKGACTEDSDCASLLCAFGRCVRACGEDAACENAEVCGRFPGYTKETGYVTGSSVPGTQTPKTLANFAQLACVPSLDPASGFEEPPGARNATLGAACTAHKDCASRVCVNNFCRKPCGKASDCASDQGCIQIAAAAPEATHAEWMQACVPNPAKMLNPGDTCSMGDGLKCRDGNCFGDSRTVANTSDRWCAPACSRDSDCTVYKDDTLAHNPLHCVPVLVDTAGGDVFKQHWVMACGK